MLHLYFLSSVFARSVVLLDPGGRPVALRRPPLGHFSCSNLQRLAEIPGAESGVARFDSHGRVALIRRLKRRRDPLATVQKCVAAFGRCQLPLKSALAPRIPAGKLGRVFEVFVENNALDFPISSLRRD